MAVAWIEYFARTEINYEKMNENELAKPPRKVKERMQIKDLDVETVLLRWPS